MSSFWEIYNMKFSEEKIETNLCKQQTDSPMQKEFVHMVKKQWNSKLILALISIYKYLCHKA